MAGKVWNTGEKMIFDLLITDSTTGLGLTGQASYTSLKIRRESDDYYWTGSAWSADVSSIVVTEDDATNEPGRYTYTLSATANASANTYYVHFTVSNTGTVQGTDTEVHISRDTTVNVYESVAV